MTLDTHSRQLFEKPIDGVLFEPIGGYQDTRDADIFRRIKHFGDMSIVGYDDADFATRADVPLTSLVHPKHQIGKWAAETLFDEMTHERQLATHQMIIKPTLSVRDSVKSR